ncbi:MAG: bifunctional hydroxymethylpyrimidine kinase/phosphomethylpyrimidine kinase [Gammaproteobacteria bacterium RIFCSPHIGHO2_12_FULL_38_11]|nr:MAG: bifunctional hydroxymethylpyrimidine kinase/phosphomethylpyrimidine kinase [Gammaproteobacteria bacterium RIFCSPHIGHO2_12_FULL_38_11]
MPKKYIRVLSIAGSDSGGGAGIQADLKTFSALHCFGMTAITALTAQNTCGVQVIHPLPAEFVTKQIESVLTDIGVDAIKIGMLESEEIIYAVIKAIKNQICSVVLDPVMFAKGGAQLISPNAIYIMRDYLFPLATIVTPNIPEAEYFSGVKINSITDMKSAARKISQSGVKNVLVKGGHAEGEKCIDVLYQSEKDLFTYFKSKRIDTKNTHGTGCTLSAAIAAELAKGKDIIHAISKSKQFLFKAIQSGQYYTLGQGQGPVNHHYARHWR